MHGIGRPADKSISASIFPRATEVQWHRARGLSSSHRNSRKFFVRPVILVRPPRGYAGLRSGARQTSKWENERYARLLPLWELLEERLKLAKFRSKTMTKTRMISSSRWTSLNGSTSAAMRFRSHARILLKDPQETDQRDHGCPKESQGPSSLKTGRDPGGSSSRKSELFNLAKAPISSRKVQPCRRGA